MVRGNKFKPASAAGVTPAEKVAAQDRLPVPNGGATDGQPEGKAEAKLAAIGKRKRGDATGVNGHKHPQSTTGIDTAGLPPPVSRELPPTAQQPQQHLRKKRQKPSAAGKPTPALIEGSEKPEQQPSPDAALAAAGAHKGRQRFRKKRRVEGGKTAASAVVTIMPNPRRLQSQAEAPSANGESSPVYNRTCIQQLLPRAS